MLDGILDVANQVYTFVGQSVYSVQSIITNNTQVITQDVLDEINARGTTLDKCVFEISLKYSTPEGKTFMYTLPYLVFKDNTICGMIQAELLNNGTILFHIDVNTDNLLDNIRYGDIIVNVYSMSSVSI